MDKGSLKKQMPFYNREDKLYIKRKQYYYILKNRFLVMNWSEKMPT